MIQIFVTARPSLFQQALPANALPMAIRALDQFRPSPGLRGADSLLGFGFQPPRLFAPTYREAAALLELGGGRAVVDRIQKGPPIFLVSSGKNDPPSGKGILGRLGRFFPGRRGTAPSDVGLAGTLDFTVPPHGGRIAVSLAASPSIDLMSVEFVRIAAKLPPPRPIDGFITREERQLLEFDKEVPRIVNLRLLSQTTMGLVLVGMDREHGRITVVKTSNPDYFRDLGGSQPGLVEKFRREMALIASIQHEGILEVYFFGTGQNGQPFMATPYLRGWGEAKTFHDLLNPAKMPKELLEEDGKISLLKFGSELALPVLDAFIFLHKIGIIHGDIKPENIGLQGKQPKVMDFGLATTLAEGGTHGGTLGYIAPEVFLGGILAGPEQDVFSLAMTFYVMLVGDHPFHFNIPKEFHERPTGEWLHLVRPPSQLRPGLSEELDGVILKGLAFDPKDRFQTMTEFRDAFREALKLTETKPFLAEAQKHFDGAQDVDLEKQYGVWQTHMISAVTVLERARDILRDYPEENLESRLGEWYLRLFLEEEKRGRGEIYEGIIAARFSVQNKFIRTPGKVVVAIVDPQVKAALVSYVDRDGVFVESKLLEPVSLRELQRGFSLPRGHYALRFEGEGALPMQYPFEIRRGEITNLQARLHPVASVPPGFAVVSSSPPLLVKQTLVTNREYIEFLNALIVAGKSAEALQHLPRVGEGKFLWHEETIQAIRRGESIAETVYFAKAGSSERDDPVLMDGPVVWISAQDAESWAEWASRKVGRDLRLPSRDEWLQMASPDGRARPWGEAPFVEGAANVRRPQQVEGMYVSQVGYHLLDVSPLSHPDRLVVDVWGNTREFTKDEYPLKDGRLMRVSVGSGFNWDAYPLVSDFWLYEEDRLLPNGFRVVAELP